MTSGGLAAVSSSAFAALYSAFGKYDVVHIHAEGPAFFAWLPKMLGKRVVTIYYTSYPECAASHFKENERYIEKIVQLWSVIVGISIFMPSSYVINKAWGSGRYFVSITGDSFRLGCTANTVKIDLMICSIPREYEALSKNSGYKPSVLCDIGMPRFDNLIDESEKLPIKQILFMPTWRVKYTNASEMDFVRDEYFIGWVSGFYCIG